MSTSAKPNPERQPPLQRNLSLLDKVVLEAIMAQRQLPTVLETLCLRVEELFPTILCSVLLLDPDGVTLRHGAAPSLPESYVQVISGAQAGPRAGSCGTAVYRGQPVIVTDIEHDPLWTDYRHLALPHGLRACWSVPIHASNGAILGTFACYYRACLAPESDHLLLIDRAAHLSRVAIEHYRTKSELQAAEARYRTLVERLPAITYMAEVGVTGRWIFVSPQIETMLGYSPQEWMADPSLWMSRIHQDDLPIALAAEERVQATGALYKAEYRMRSRNGEILWFRDEGKIMTDSVSAKPLLQGVLYEITEHKRLEEQLRQAQKMEAVGQLAGGVAHDFNNLLMVIAAHTDRIIERHSEREDCHEDANKISGAVLRAKSLTQRLLAFSRKQVLKPEVIELRGVLEDSAAMIRRVLTENIAFDLSVDSDLYPVKIDRVQLEQAILNLTVNARDAMPNGGRIRISACNTVVETQCSSTLDPLPAGDYVKISVEDNGTGMDMETQTHIFEPFFTTKGPDKGTGLGLAMVYGVVSQSGGTIGVLSTPGHGSTFDVFLPRTDSAVVSNEEKVPESLTVTGTETVLLVEDQNAIRELACDYLTKLGYKVLAASDGQSAMEIARNNRIDLLITDIVMPNMGGLELAERITSMMPGIKLLYMSGYPDAGTDVWQESVAHGALLHKPFSLNALATHVRRMLDPTAGKSQNHLA